MVWIKNLKLVAVFSVLIFSISGFAGTSQKSQKEYEPYRIWLAIPASGFIGFGLGHAIQSRYKSEYGWAYTIVDSAVMAWGLSYSFGDCRSDDRACTDRRNQNSNAASAVWLASRVVQLADVSIWSYNYHNKYHSTFSLLPTKSGGQLLASISF